MSYGDYNSRYFLPLAPAVITGKLPSLLASELKYMILIINYSKCVHDTPYNQDQFKGQYHGVLNTARVNPNGSEKVPPFMLKCSNYI
jgi:hypothetical protein